MTFLTVDNVHKRFGEIPSLRGVSMETGYDELSVVLGPTGAGKTTLLRAIAGLETIDSGSVTFDGVSVDGWKPAARDTALVFQNFSLYPGWTVRRNLEFPLKAPARRLTTKEIDKRIAWVAGMLRIERLLDRNAEQLSGGEMQRVAIGRAIVRRPRMFLMDEPLTNLDAKLREELRVELVVLRRELGLPMVYVTHDWMEAMSMGDSLSVLSEGRILQRGVPGDIYNYPHHPDVARQLGLPAANIFPVVVMDEQVRRTTNDAKLADIWLGKLPDSAPSGGSHLLGVRPEDVELGGGRHPARVVVVDEAGPQVIIQADWGGCPIHLILDRVASCPRVGETIHPRPRLDRAMWWPSVSTTSVSHRHR